MPVTSIKWCQKLREIRDKQAIAHKIFHSKCRVHRDSKQVLFYFLGSLYQSRKLNKLMRTKRYTFMIHLEYLITATAKRTATYLCPAVSPSRGRQFLYKLKTLLSRLSTVKRILPSIRLPGTRYPRDTHV